MKTKFTPGPWVISPEPFPDGLPYYHIIAGKGFCGKNVPSSGFKLSGVISDADAHLIAAAPELYEALRAAIEAMKMVNWNKYDADFIQAQAVLAKARGEV